jgi:SNF2 family DNA or RNA helicase
VCKTVAQAEDIKVIDDTRYQSLQDRVSKLELQHVGALVEVPVKHECMLRLQSIMSASLAIERGTKIDALLKYVMNIISSDPTSKCLIFSAFPRMLDLIAACFRSNFIAFRQLMGSAVQRKEAVLKFQHENDCKVLLMCLRHDNSGLTLTCANHVFFMEPSLSIPVEAQACSRVHRIGQSRQAFVHKFIISNSIEEKIQKDNSLKNKLIQSNLPTTSISSNVSTGINGMSTQSEDTLDAIDVQDTNDIGQNAFESISVNYLLQLFDILPENVNL